MTDVRERRSEEGDEGRGADGEEDAHVKGESILMLSSSSQETDMLQIASPRPAEDELDTAE